MPLMNIEDSEVHCARFKMHPFTACCDSLSAYHALCCQMSGFSTLHHNTICDISDKLLHQTSPNTCIEPYILNQAYSHSAAKLSNNTPSCTSTGCRCLVSVVAYKLLRFVNSARWNYTFSTLFPDRD